MIRLDLLYVSVEFKKLEIFNFTKIFTVNYIFLLNLPHQYSYNYDV